MSSAKVSELSNKVKAGGLAAVLTAIAGVGVSTEQYMTINKLTDANIELTQYHQKVVNDFQASYMELQDKAIKCWTKNGTVVETEEPKEENNSL